MKYLMLLFSIVLYLFILVVVYCVYITFFKVNVVFYSSLYSVIIALFVYIAIVSVVPIFQCFTIFERVNIFLIAVMLGYVVAISVPTVIDRSLSFYILEKLQQRGGCIRLSKFNYIFTNEYVREHKLVDVRLTEQAESGTIEIVGDCVRLTERGYTLARFSRFFRQHFLPRQRLLRGKYTDELIDPFSKSDVTPDYLCK